MNALTAGPSVAEPTTVPFELVRNQIVLEVWIGERGPYSMLLDTGVTPSGLHVEVARENGLLASAEPVGYAGGVGSGKVPLYAAEIRGLRIGSLEPEPFPSVAMDNSHLSERLGRPLHGILGHAFLDGRRVRIDYPGRRVIFEPDAGPASADSELHTFELEYVENDIMPRIGHLEVNGVALSVSLDTGSSLTLELYPEGARLAGVEPQAGGGGTVTGARGDEEVSSGRARRIALGPFERSDQEVTLPPAARPGNRLGNLGNGFLRHFVLTLDYRERTVTLESPRPLPRGASESERAGFAAGPVIDRQNTVATKVSGGQTPEAASSCRTPERRGCR